jgi:hypothetical protein
MENKGLRNDIIDGIAGLFALFGQAPVPVALAAYGDQLVELGPEVLEEIKLCIVEQVSGELTKMPGVKDFKMRMGIEVEPDKKDQAREAAAKILEAVGKFGYPNWQPARDFMGSLAAEVVKRQGGWVAICESITNQNKYMLQAQWRDLALALLEKPPGLRERAPQLEGVDVAEGQAGIKHPEVDVFQIAKGGAVGSKGSGS